MAIVAKVVRVDHGHMLEASFAISVSSRSGHPWLFLSLIEDFQTLFAGHMLTIERKRLVVPTMPT